MSTSQREIWNLYLNAWRAESREEKARLLDECLAAEIRYADPYIELQGREELLDYMVDFHTHVPGGHFVTTWFQEHHERSLARWDMRDAEGEFRREGFSFATYDASGRLTSLNGFFEVS